jgi:hypothetical protein
MSSWGLLLALSGFNYSVPEGRLGFAPALRPEEFRTFWSLGSIWGLYEQNLTPGNIFSCALQVENGRLELREFTFELPSLLAGKKTRSVECLANGGKIKSSFEQAGSRIKIKLPRTNLQAGSSLTIRVH